jgi:anti-sigma B factor antagonist
MAINDLYRLTFVDTAGGERVACIEGEVDMASAPAIQQAVAATPGGAVALDMADVEFIDSAGIRMLIELARSTDDSNAPLRLIAPEGSVVRRMVELTGIGQLFSLADRPGPNL